MEQSVEDDMDTGLIEGLRRDWNAVQGHQY